MAFNFNWAPLSGDPDFYKRAEELLTNAMNKNEKPPIIVDDIIVTELNLGDIPPDMEVVEISDIGIDRFRGTFKMCYIGNAYITIKTRVQANPLNTYLVTRPSYTSPQPLAAATGLTIPLQITLSDFKLSAIIILVFSRQKGLTIVFRNDPLESLKVSSTFDSMPFIANYLQQVIEKQLRTLFMDELPAIIHRMSLRLWVPEHRAKEEQALRDDETTQDEPALDPLASPPQDPVDSLGVALTPAEVASMTLDSHVDTQSLFSRKNLLRLATLTDSHRTLSLFTPNIRDVVFRAWTGPLERGEMSGQYSKAPTPALSRTHSYSGSISSTYSFDPTSTIRPSLHSYGSSFNGRLKSHSTRKRKKRVVNLRKQPETGEIETIIEDGSTITDSASVTESNSDAATAFSAPSAMTKSSPVAFMDPVTPPVSPRALRQTNREISDALEMTPTLARPNQAVERPLIESLYSSPQKHEHPAPRSRQRRVVDLTGNTKVDSDNDQTPRASTYLSRDKEPARLQHRPINQKATVLSYDAGEPSALSDDPQVVHSSSSSSTKQATTPPLPNFFSFITEPGNTGSIAERAWMMKVAAELSKRYEEEKLKGNFEIPIGSKSGSSRDGTSDALDAPPAYSK